MTYEDHCAIYILIAGSYTPFLRISLEDKVLGSVYLLSFLWICCLGGIFVEAFHPNWIYKSKFSLAMYLGMGWSCLVCIPDLREKLSDEAVQLIILGGIAYTSGVPFFVRNNNLDHSIWHLFVLAGSILHWLCVYVHVAPMGSQIKWNFISHLVHCLAPTNNFQQYKLLHGLHQLSSDSNETSRHFITSIRHDYHTNYPYICKLNWKTKISPLKNNSKSLKSRMVSTTIKKSPFQR